MNPVNRHLASLLADRRSVPDGRRADAGGPSVPSASRFAVVAAPAGPAPEILERAAKTFGIVLSITPVSGPDDFDAVLARAKREAGRLRNVGRCLTDELDPPRMLWAMASKRTTKRAPAHAFRNVVPIDRLPRHIVRLSDANIIAWMAEATQLTLRQMLTRPRLARERLLAALKRERRKARKRRIAT